MGGSDSPSPGPKPNDTDQDILNVFKKTTDPVLSTAEVANNISIGHRATYNRLKSLEDTGELQSKKVGGKSTVWWLAGEAI
ncbi:winged helix-turn-helix domain-containing protein [Halorubrum trapanicum]|uniref:winged helix-turn-helix domain-containing protein n=1 Tax=Halorubrum trapanicum TaxID=29284 RepID=UPI003C6FB01E